MPVRPALNADRAASPPWHSRSPPRPRSRSRPTSSSPRRSTRRVADVWKAWTTAEGIESFFAPKAAKVEPVPGGAFELWFGVNNPEGVARQRGLTRAQRQADGAVRVRMERAAGNPDDPKAAHAGLSRLRAASRQPDEVTLRNFGYGTGDDWAKNKAYFESAWPAVMGPRKALRDERLTAMDLEFPARSSSSPAPARASASRAPRRSRARAPRSRSCRAAAAISTPRSRDCRSRRSKPVAIAADLARADEAARDGRRGRGAARADRRARQFGRRGEAHAPDELTAQAWHDAMDAKFFSYMHPTRHRRQADGRARRAAPSSTSSAWAARSPIPSTCRRRGQCGADARHGRTRRGVRSQGVRVNAISPGTHADRPRAGGTGRRGEDDRHARGGAPGAAAGEDSAAPRGNAGGSARSRAVPARPTPRATSPARSFRWMEAAPPSSDDGTPFRANARAAPRRTAAYS